MVKKSDVKLNKIFRPSEKLRLLFKDYLILGFLFLVLPWYIPAMILSSPGIFKTITTLGIIFVFSFLTYYLPKYFENIRYKFTKETIMWKRGIWFKITGIVPYSMITNIDVTQGPISRRRGLYTLKIQTAGYSGQNPNAEIRIEGVEEPEKIKEFIIKYVKNYKNDKKNPGSVNEQILKELKKIRKTLEK